MPEKQHEGSKIHQRCVESKFLTFAVFPSYHANDLVRYEPFCNEAMLFVPLHERKMNDWEPREAEKFSDWPSGLQRTWSECARTPR
jgi:hypothetical protein